MELTELLNSVNVIQVTGDVQRKDVASIEYDSRKVKSNSVFVAIKGFKTDGHKFIQNAINSGAIAVILEDDNALPDELFRHSGTVKILVSNSRDALAEVSVAFYKKPSGKLNVIGITGTNGKTTTSFYIKKILETAGYKTGLLGTIKNMIGEKEITSALTTPEANDLNKMLSEMVPQNVTHVVMEVSSHSLALNRVKGLHFSSAIYTNITSDHLDFHGDFQNYFNSKKILFDELDSPSFIIYNKDDEHSSEIIKESKAERLSFGIEDEADFKIEKVKYDLNGTMFQIKVDEKQFDVSTSLIGNFNAYNATAAFACCYKMKIDPEQIIEGIRNTEQVPGRFAVIGRGNKKAVVDYSHTADSLEKAITTLRDIVKSEKKIITVFGCGGERDKEKRPVMGKIATELSDEVIVTSDNPRNEDPKQIINEIIKGIKRKNYKVIEKRKDAIDEAISKSDDNTVILIAGKGHENYQEIKGKRFHFSDKEIAEELLK